MHIKNVCKEYKKYQENHDKHEMFTLFRNEMDKLRNETENFLQSIASSSRISNTQNTDNSNNTNNTNNTNTKSHNNHSNNKNIQNNIYINALGKENIDYISKEYIQAIVNDGPYGCIQKLIKQIHFNPKHKENQNIRIPNKRDKFALVYDGDKWIMENKHNMITRVTENAYGIITDHCMDLNNRRFDKFCNEFDRRENSCRKRVNGDTELLILNNQQINEE
jgi:hypothetical protein